jgi:hypothetical protein
MKPWLCLPFLVVKRCFAVVIPDGYVISENLRCLPDCFRQLFPVALFVFGHDLQKSHFLLSFDQRTQERMERILASVVSRFVTQTMFGFALFVEYRTRSTFPSVESEAILIAGGDRAHF